MSPVAYLVAPLVAAANPGPLNAGTYVLEMREAKRVEAMLAFAHRYDSLKAREWIVFAAQAPELPSQKNVKTRVEPKAEPVVERGDMKRPLLLARIPAKTPALTEGYRLRLIYEATLYSRKLTTVPPGAKTPPIAELPERVRKAALASAGDVHHETPAFRQWLKEQKQSRGAMESDLDFARRVFQALRGKVKYEFRAGGRMDRLASSVCRASASDCGGLSALFCGVMRAHGIPARELVG